ncbi:IS66 family transposase [Phocaeicola abscessus]|uniref:IS66 family transposase n=1 Tax=Phocaeicola abscessus TaxID=555313 RepID=UPI000685C12B|nr:IS66 family transposase [Phocaeicola abscessus]
MEATNKLLNETIMSLKSTLETMHSLLIEAKASKEADTLLIKELCATIESLKQRLTEREAVTEKVVNENRQLSAMVRNANKQNESVKIQSSSADRKEDDDSKKDVRKVIRRSHAGCKIIVRHVDLYPDSKDGDVVENTGLEEETVHYSYKKGYIEEIHYHRHKQRINDTLKCAKAPLTPLQNSQYESSFIAHIIALRFGYALPIERVVKMVNAEGFDLSKTTAFNLLEGAYVLLENIGTAIYQTIIGDTYIGMDETYHRLTNCVEPNKNGKRTKKAYMWEMFSYQYNLVRYHFSSKGSRSSETGAEFLGSYKELLQSDALRFYRNLGEEQGNGITRLACVQHVKREWINIGDTIPEAVKIASLYSELYHKEHMHKIGEDGWTETDNLRWREEYASPILDEIESRCRLIMKSGVPKTPMYMAAQYSLNEMPAVREIFKTGHCRLGNNLCEILNRDISLSRRNSLFFVSENGAVYATLFYSIVASCKLHNIDPEEYLTWLMDKVINMSPLYNYDLLRPLLPDMYKKDEPELI